MTTDW